MADVLQQHGIHAVICDSLAQCAPRINTSTAALLLTEEALDREQLPLLLQVLKAQPEWSELPVLVLASGGEARWNTLLELTAAAPGAVTPLERPVGATTLVETVKVALRSRRRQHEVHDLLDERQAHASQLQAALEKRTTEVVQAQQQLATSQRMAAVGTLAAGLAHDLANVLFPLGGRLDRVLADSRLTGEHRADLNVVVALVDHLRQMARNLSMFSRDPDSDGTEGYTVLQHWVTRVRDLIESSIPDPGQRDVRIRMQWDIPEDLPPAGLAPHRLTQSVLNLVHNARDAIYAKNRSSTGEHASGLIRIRARTDDNGAAQVVVGVTDDGIGMTEEVKRRSIEPFYTTKERPGTPGEGPSVSTGSGMGLALVSGIARKCGGELRITSKPGEGATIELVVPVASSPPVTADLPLQRNLRSEPAARATHEPGRNGAQRDVKTA